MSQLTRFTASSGPGSGTVTSISAGTGITLTPNPITTTGTVALTVPVTIADGGTNATTFATTDGTVIFDGTRLVTTATGVAGQILTSNGAGVAPTYQNAAASSISLTGDTGGALTGNSFTIHSDVAANNSGSTVSFAGSGTTLLFDVTDGVGNTIVGHLAGNATISGTGNTALGQASLHAATSGTENIAMGATAGNLLTTGSNNTLVGTGAGLDLLTGSNNIALGHGAAANYTGAEANNIIIGNAGTLGDSAKIRIGTNGTQTACYVAGVDGVNVGSVAKVLTMASDQLGTATITAGTNVTVTPSANTITIAANTQSQVVNYVTTNGVASPYVALSTDYYIGVSTSVGAVTIKLPDAPAVGRIFVVKDRTGLAASANITVTTVSGADLFDGATSFVMNTAYQSAQFIFNNIGGYEVF